MSTLKGTILLAAALVWTPACGGQNDGRQPISRPSSGGQPRSTEPERTAPTSDTGMTAEEAATIALRKAKGEATPDEIARLKKYIEGESGGK